MFPGPVFLHLQQIMMAMTAMRIPTPTTIPAMPPTPRLPLEEEELEELVEELPRVHKPVEEETEYPEAQLEQVEEEVQLLQLEPHDWQVEPDVLKYPGLQIEQVTLEVQLSQFRGQAAHPVFAVAEAKFPVEEQAVQVEALEQVEQLNGQRVQRLTAKESK